MHDQLVDGRDISTVVNPRSYRIKIADRFDAGGAGREAIHNLTEGSLSEAIEWGRLHVTRPQVASLECVIEVGGHKLAINLGTLPRLTTPD